jgi:hypothetical protein
MKALSPPKADEFACLQTSKLRHPESFIIARDLVIVMKGSLSYLLDRTPTARYARYASHGV